MTAAAEKETTPLSTGTRLAARIGRHSAIYGVGTLGTLMAGFITVAAYTRLLDPSSFGQLAVLMTISSAITSLANLGTLQGTNRLIYGSAGDEDEGAEDDLATPMASDPRRAFSTGLALTLCVGSFLFAVAFFLQKDMATHFLRGPEDSDLVVLAALTGCIAAVNRLSLNVLRLQRRSVAFLVLSIVQVLGGTLAAVVLLALGSGVSGVMIGLAVGNFTSLLISIQLLRHDLRLRINLADALQILRGGLYYVPLIISFQVIQLGGVLLVSNTAGFVDAGLYRVAQRLSSPVSYGTSIFQQAWGPMRKDALHMAADNEAGGKLNLYAKLATYYLAFVALLVLCISMFASELVDIAGEGYEDAVAVIPLAAMAIAGHGFFTLSYRLAEMNSKRVWFLLMSIIAGTVFLSSCAFLIPRIGASGAALAGVLGWGVGTVAMVIAGLRLGDPLPFQWREMFTIVVLTTSVWAVGFFVLPDSLLGTAGRLILVCVWVAGLFVFKAFPRKEFADFFRFARLASRTETKRGMKRRIARAHPSDASLLDLMLRHHTSAESLGAKLNSDEEAMLAELTRALRRTLDDDSKYDYDAQLGGLMVVVQPFVQRESQLAELVASGADAVDADRLLRAAEVVSARHVRKRDRSEQECLEGLVESWKTEGDRR